MDFTYSANLSAAAGANTGAFMLSNIPAATYTVSVKGDKWLQSNAIIAIAPASATANLSVLLRAGDANGENIIDTSDFGLLVGAYNGDSSVPGSGYDPVADFNCDSVVDTRDFGLLVGNYNTVGDN